MYYFELRPIEKWLYEIPREGWVLLSELHDEYSADTYPENYRAYLSSPHWREFRAAQLASVSCCAVCTNKPASKSTDRNGLVVHHRHYDSIGDEQPKDVIVLCSLCHRIVHSDIVTAFMNLAKHSRREAVIYAEKFMMYAEKANRMEHRPWGEYEGSYRPALLDRPECQDLIGALSMLSQYSARLARGPSGDGDTYIEGAMLAEAVRITALRISAALGLELGGWSISESYPTPELEDLGSIEMAEDIPGLSGGFLWSTDPRKNN